MRICIIHGRRPAREVLARALSSRLNAEVDAFSHCEDVLAASLDCDRFVVYNNFHKKMSGFGGVKRIRNRKPNALIVGVTSNPNFTSKFISAGADSVVLRAGNEIAELVDILRQGTGDQPQGA
jgi:DNA-binding NarL/FixJ family response regulator